MRTNNFISAPLSRMMVTTVNLNWRLTVVGWTLLEPHCLLILQNVWCKIHAFFGWIQCGSSLEQLCRSLWEPVAASNAAESWLAVAWWGRGTQAGLRGWIIHSHVPRLYAVGLIFSNACVSEKSHPPGSISSGKTSTRCHPNCAFLQAVRWVVTWRYRANLVQCTASSCLTGLRYAGTSLKMVRVGCQTSLLCWTDSNIITRLSFENDRIQHWHWKFSFE